MSALSILAIIGAYCVVGFCSAAVRAYLDPVMIERGIVTSGYSWSNGRSLFYGEAIVFCFLVWPVMVPLTASRFGFERFRTRGIEAMARRKEIARQTEIDQREVERIIREAKL